MRPYGRASAPSVPAPTLGDVSHAIERHATKNGYSIVRDFCSHGIGREMHEAPQVLHFGKPGSGMKLREGMVFTIEPMLNQGRRTVATPDSGWTVVTTDGKLSAQFEHSVAVAPRRRTGRGAVGGLITAEGPLPAGQGMSAVDPLRT